MTEVIQKQDWNENIGGSGSNTKQNTVHMHEKNNILTVIHYYTGLHTETVSRGPNASLWTLEGAAVSTDVSTTTQGSVFDL